VIGTLAADGWTATIGTARRPGPGRAAAPPSRLLAVPKPNVNTGSQNQYVGEVVLNRISSLMLT